MFEPEERDRERTPAERWVIFGFAAFILAAFAAELLSDFEPVKASVVLIALFWIPLLVLHEAGHAVVAGWLDWRVERIVLGFGRCLRVVEVKGIPVEIRALPVEGFVQTSPGQGGTGLQSAGIYLAGPGVELALAAAIYGVIGPALLVRTDSPAMIAWQSLALASAMGGVLNLIPHSTLRGGTEIPNDGLGIFYSLFGRG